jgi:hypothetical protein
MISAKKAAERVSTTGERNVRKETIEHGGSVTITEQLAATACGIV